MLAVPTRTWFRTAVRPQLFTRAASTRVPRGLSNVLQKNSDDVVITFGKRTAVGRAKKGQWKDTTVDELVYALFKVRHNLFFYYQFFFFDKCPSQATLEKTKLDPNKIDDICVGRSSPLLSHGSMIPPCL